MGKSPVSANALTVAGTWRELAGGDARATTQARLLGSMREGNQLRLGVKRGCASGKREHCIILAAIELDHDLNAGQGVVAREINAGL